MDEYDLVEWWVAEAIGLLGKTEFRECGFGDVAHLAGFPEPGLDAWVTLGLAQYALDAPESGARFRFELSTVLSAGPFGSRVPEILDSMAAAFVREFLSTGSTPSREVPYELSLWPELEGLLPPSIQAVFFGYSLFMPEHACHVEDVSLGELFLLEVVMLTESEALLLRSSPALFRERTSNGSVDLLDGGRFLRG